MVNENSATSLVEQYNKHCVCEHREIKQQKEQLHVDTEESVLPTSITGDGSYVTSCFSILQADTDRQTDRQTDRETDRQTDRQTHTHTQSSKQMQYSWLTAFSKIHMQC